MDENKINVMPVFPKNSPYTEVSISSIKPVRTIQRDEDFYKTRGKLIRPTLPKPVEDIPHKIELLNEIKSLITTSNVEDNKKVYKK